MKELMSMKPMVSVNVLFVIIDTLLRLILDYSQKYVMVVMT